MKFYAGTYFNVPLYFHWLWFVIVAAVGILNPTFFAPFLTVFFFVVLHEYGHCITAKKFNTSVSDITMYPFGGLARIDIRPERPLEELFIILAGPMVNIFLALVLTCVHAFTGGSYLMLCIYLNAALAVFNMLPVFPLDGGRCLRSVLTIFMRGDYVRSTVWCIHIARCLGVACIVVGVYLGDFFWVCLFILILFGQQAELIAVEQRALLAETLPKLAKRLNKPHLLEAPWAEIMLEFEELPSPEYEEFHAEELLPYLRQMSGLP